ncbi:MAG: ATP-binding protein [Bacteroidales bacterium]|nr:ATP-binding protein [Bacteroidales bacterium]MBQ5549648.1 ATP-binding protein [Bacteroidales bacterium]MBQ5575966.1 ATP-binding protein [Bacteroidales bacterium]
MLYILTAIASVAAWLYCNHLTDLLKQQEQKNISLWAESIREIEKVDLDGEISPIVYTIIQENSTIPAILKSNIDGQYSYINIDIDTTEHTLMEVLLAEIEEMKKDHDPINIDRYYTLYYKDSSIIRQLETYPIIQLIVTFMIIALTIVGIRISNKADQSIMMVGMSKETAHQLGTPITSLLAWVEILKMENYNPEITCEVEKDVTRLVQITDRFSRIGNTPELKPENLGPVLSKSIDYLRSRTSSNVNYTVEIPENSSIIVPMCIPLIEWVVENIVKNAIDAMQGKGSIHLRLIDSGNNAVIEISDTGKGIPKRNFKTVFKPGYTTKKHGWGLGLSLAQRIVNDYHKGKIIVKSSEPGKGTTFKITLPKK